MSASFTFTLPEELAAKEPPERRGLSRDRLRLMVIDRALDRVTLLFELEITGLFKHSRPKYLNSKKLTANS